jgi:hypothetical protein
MNRVFISLSCSCSSTEHRGVIISTSALVLKVPGFIQETAYVDWRFVLLFSYFKRIFGALKQSYATSTFFLIHGSRCFNHNYIICCSFCVISFAEAVK